MRARVCVCIDIYIYIYIYISIPTVTSIKTFISSLIKFVIDYNASKFAFLNETKFSKHIRNCPSRSELSASPSSGDTPDSGQSDASDLFCPRLPRLLFAHRNITDVSPCNDRLRTCTIQLGALR